MGWFNMLIKKILEWNTPTGEKMVTVFYEEGEPEHITYSEYERMVRQVQLELPLDNPNSV